MTRLLSYYYTLICSLSPLLAIYSVSGSIMVLDVLILSFYGISIISYIRSEGRKLSLPYFTLFVFLLLHSIVVFFFTGDDSTLMRAMHLINYVFFLAFFNRCFFLSEFAYKVIKIVSIVATIVLILQHLCEMLLGITIPIEFLIPVDPERQSVNEDTGIRRFSSFFIEPASYAQYIICALVIELLYRAKSNMQVVIFLCLGCILSTSNTATACMVITFVYYFIRNGFINKKMFLLIIASVLIFIIARPFIETHMERISDGGSADGRFSAYYEIFSYVYNPLWGVGFVSPDTWGDAYLAGFARLFIYFGFIGVVVYLITYFHIITKSKMSFLVFLCLLLNLGSDTLLSVFFLYYNCFIEHSLNFPKVKHLVQIHS